MSKTNATAEPEVDGSFLKVIQNHRKGGALTDLAAALREVAGAVSLVGKPGVVILKLNLLPSKAGAFIVVDDISTKVPKADKEGSIFYADENHNLQREDPKQQVLQLRSVEGGAVDLQPAALKKVEGA